MATLKEIEATYDYLDDIVRLDMGDYGEVTCALFDGDFTKSLEQAQRDKHDYMLNSLRFVEGFRVLDIGCGWGPFLNTLRDRGGQGVGITLSPKQARACARNGLAVYLKDWKAVDVNTFGTFDGIVSVGAFEHFCSIDEYLAGKQEKVYEAFFGLCRQLLSPGSRLFLQTMFWGKNAPRYRDISLNARRGSNEYLLAVMMKAYPGSWLPAEEDQIERCAAPYFRLVTRKNGRKDYIETMNRWDRVWKWSPTKVAPAIKMLPNFLTDPDFRHKLEALRNGYNKECLVREVMDHQRFVFEAID